MAAQQLRRPGVAKYLAKANPLGSCGYFMGPPWVVMWGKSGAIIFAAPWPISARQAEDEPDNHRSEENVDWHQLLTPLNLLLCSGISFCLGLLLGHRLALGRDKRQEFNAITEDDYLFLRQEWQAGLEGKSYSRGELGDLILAESYFGPSELRRFKAATKNYRESRKHRYKPRPGVVGGVEVDPEKMAYATQCTYDLLRFLKRR